MLSELATATYPDGSTPDVGELVKLATFLFGAGQDTSAKLLGNAMLYLCELPDVQHQLRRDRSLIPAFLEEVLRLSDRLVVMRDRRKIDERRNDDVSVRDVLEIIAGEAHPEGDPHA